MRGIIDFAGWVAVVSLAASFFLGLMSKWKVLEWLQIHAPNDFLLELFSCRFCLAFWTSLILCMVLALASGEWLFLFIPMCSTVITRELW